MSIVVIGDVMLDKFSYGRVKRLNPESPCPLLHIENEDYKLGGAANVAANIKALGEETSLVGAIGKDLSGQMFVDACKEIDLPCTPLYTSFPTITKQRFIEKTYHQQMLRVDYEERIELSEKEQDSLISVLSSLQPTHLVVSDYNKGTMSPELITKIIAFANKQQIPILVDSKPQHMTYFKGVYLMKPNFKEFRELIGKDIPNDDQIIEQEAQKIVEEYDINLVVTRGDKGATLVTKDGKVSHLHTQAKQVYDVTGAGDTFIAALAVALSTGKTLEEAVVFGNKASAIAVGKVGTSIVTKEEIA